MEYAEDRDAWEKQPGESSRAFVAFAVYRDLDPAVRNAQLVADRTHRKLAHIQRLMKVNKWRDRVDLYEMHLDRDRQRQVEERRRETNESISLIARNMLGKVAARLQAMDDDAIRGLTVWELTRLYREAVHAYRLVEGQSTEILDVVTEDEVSREIRRLTEEMNRRDASRPEPSSERMAALADPGQEATPPRTS